ACSPAALFCLHSIPSCKPIPREPGGALTSRSRRIIYCLRMSRVRSYLDGSRRSTLYGVRELAPAFTPEADFQLGNRSTTHHPDGMLQSGGKPPLSRGASPTAVAPPGA